MHSLSRKRSTCKSKNRTASETALWDRTSQSTKRCSTDVKRRTKLLRRSQPSKASTQTPLTRHERHTKTRCSKVSTTTTPTPFDSDSKRTLQYMSLFYLSSKERFQHLWILDDAVAEPTRTIGNVGVAVRTVR